MHLKANKTMGDIDEILSYEGFTVYSNEFAERLRADNLERLRQKKQIFKMIPQSGFQENVCINEADVLFCLSEESVEEGKLPL